MVKQICDAHMAHINKKTECTISVIHPGSGNTQECDLSKEEMLIHAALVKHLREHNQRINEYRCTCVFNTDNVQ